MDVPSINGHYYSYADATIIVDGTRYVGVKSISYSHKLEPGKVRGTSAQLIGRTKGEYNAEGSIELNKGTAAAIRTAFGNGWMEKSFQIMVNYSASSELPLITDELLGCRVTADDNDLPQGTDAPTEKWSLDILRIKQDGVDPLENMI